MIVPPYSLYMEDIINSVRNLFVPKQTISAAEDPALSDVAYKYTRTGIILACIPGGREENEPKTESVFPYLTLIQGGKS